jgi:ferric-dicitrate binding protein FerR (iron transport regulator)
MIRMFAAAVLALALPLAASAAAVVESVKGTVRSGEAPLAQGQRVTAPASIATGAGSQVSLKFDDGMQIVLDQNSLLRVVDFRGTGGGAQDRAVFELLRGGARVVTGRIARDNPLQFFFRTPQAQLMVERPADFSVVLINPAYITVHVGSVLVSNGWGTATLAAGTDTVVVANNNVAPGLVARSAIPGNAAAAMQNLNVASVGLPAGGSAVGAAATAGTGEGVGFAVPAVLVTLGIAAVAVAKEGDDNGSVTPPSHH